MVWIRDTKIERQRETASNHGSGGAWTTLLKAKITLCWRPTRPLQNDQFSGPIEALFGKLGFWGTYLPSWTLHDWSYWDHVRYTRSNDKSSDRRTYTQTCVTVCSLRGMSSVLTCTLLTMLLASHSNNIPLSTISSHINKILRTIILIRIQ